MILFTEFHRITNAYEIDSNAVVHIHGIFTKVTRRADLLAISDADVSQNPWQRVLGYGDVSVRAFSKDSTMWIKDIDNPKEFVEFLEMKMNKKRSASGGGGGTRSNR